MSNPFLAEVRPLPFNFAPTGWATCDGQILPITQNTALFSLLGTTYGGNGIQNFALPDLRSRTPIHAGQLQGGNLYSLGEFGGVENVTLTLNEIPSHSHSLTGSSAAANDKRPLTGSAYATSTGPGPVSPDQNYYGTASSLVALNPATLAATGSSQPHSNLQPYLTISWCIALQGVYPARN